MNLISKIIDKIWLQWKTIRKAFMALDVSHTGMLSPDDLKSYLTHWGVTPSVK